MGRLVMVNAPASGNPHGRSPYRRIAPATGNAASPDKGANTFVIAVINRPSVQQSGSVLANAIC
jgi:hypothetical protein